MLYGSQCLQERDGTLSRSKGRGFNEGLWIEAWAALRERPGADVP